MLNYRFASPDGGSQQLCWTWFQTKATVRALLITSTLSIVIINLVLKVRTIHKRRR
jgi:hypothetical protein